MATTKKFIATITKMMQTGKDEFLKCNYSVAIEVYERCICDFFRNISSSLATTTVTNTSSTHSNVITTEGDTQKITTTKCATKRKRKSMCLKKSTKLLTVVIQENPLLLELYYSYGDCLALAGRIKDSISIFSFISEKLLTNPNQIIPIGKLKHLTNGLIESVLMLNNNNNNNFIITSLPKYISSTTKVNINLSSVATSSTSSATILNNDKKCFIVTDNKQQQMVVDPLFCGICEDLLKYPVTTICGHTFCQQCCNNKCQCKICGTKFSKYPLNFNYKQDVLVRRLCEKWWPNEIQSSKCNEKSELLLQQNALDESLKLCNESLENYPNSYKGLLIRSEVLYRLKHYQSSLADADNALKCRPTSYKAYYRRALALSKFQAFDDALLSHCISINLSKCSTNFPKHLKQEIAKLLQQILVPSNPSICLNRRITKPYLINVIKTRRRKKCKQDDETLLIQQNHRHHHHHNHYTRRIHYDYRNIEGIDEDQDDYDDDNDEDHDEDNDENLSENFSDFKYFNDLIVNGHYDNLVDDNSNIKNNNHKNGNIQYIDGDDKDMDIDNDNDNDDDEDIDDGHDNVDDDDVDDNDENEKQIIEEYLGQFSKCRKKYVKRKLYQCACHTMTKNKASTFVIPKYISRLGLLFDRMETEVMNLKKIEQHYNSNVLHVNKPLIDSSDFDCVLCCRTLWKPVVTLCGHTYCLVCLDRCLDYSSCCPLCMSPLVDEYGSHKLHTPITYSSYSSKKCVTRFIEIAMQRFLPKAYAKRQKQEIENEPSVPIFICTTAFPYVPCPLFVYEPRYRLMIRRAIESGERQFGIALPHNGRQRYADFGTMLDIRDCVLLGDGCSILSTVGCRRFRIVGRDEKDGYDTAKVEYIYDEQVNDGDAVFELHQKVYREAINWYNSLPEHTKEEILKSFGSMPPLEDHWQTIIDGPAWAWYIIAILPLNQQLKVEIMATTNLEKRLRAIDKTLEYVDAQKKRSLRVVACEGLKTCQAIDCCQRASTSTQLVDERATTNHLTEFLS